MVRKARPARCAMARPVNRPGVATVTLDGADQVDQCVEVKASFVILRGLTVRAPKINGIVLGEGSHDVVIEVATSAAGAGSPRTAGAWTTTRRFFRNSSRS